MGSGHPVLKIIEEREGIQKQVPKNNYMWMERLACGEKVIKTGTVFRKKKRRGDIIKVYKVLVLDNTLLWTNWELLFLLFLSLSLKKTSKNVP